MGEQQAVTRYSPPFVDGSTRLGAAGTDNRFALLETHLKPGAGQEGWFVEANGLTRADALTPEATGPLFDKCGMVRTGAGNRQP